jgi:hypothetical protein
MSKLGTATINGHQVSFFKPPHSEPDFPWVDVEELASAFLPADEAKRLVEHAQGFDRDARPVATARNGDRIATIMPHVLAQGLCAAIDQFDGHAEEEGPAFAACCRAAGRFAAEHWPMSFDDIITAFHHPGGPFLCSKGAAQ